MAKLITLQDFKEKYGHKPEHMVVVYADWCPACQHMKKQLGPKFKNYNNLHFYESQQVAPGVVPHYPYVMVFQSGQIRESDVNELYEWLNPTQMSYSNQKSAPHYEQQDYGYDQQDYGYNQQDYGYDQMKNSNQKLGQKKKISLDDLDQKYGPQDFHMVVIYADWCGHCQNMISKLGKKFANTKNLTFYESNQVTRDVTDYFPRVMIYKNGYVQDGTVDNLYQLVGLLNKP